MTDEEKITRVLYEYEDGGLVSQDIDKVLALLDDELLGIGVGEQGFVESKEDVRRVFLEGLKNDGCTQHSVSCENIRIRLHEEGFANLCAKVIVKAECGRTVSSSQFSQSLTLVRRGEDWKICGLHASVPVITEECVAAYPLKFAEKTLQSLKEKLSEEAFLAEEQYRQAILADTIAFYIINFTENSFEKCQLNGGLCAYVEPGTNYERFITESSPSYLTEDDRRHFLENFSLNNIRRAFQDGKKELSLEYRAKFPDGSFSWLVTIIRLITDVVTGEQKGIMYVKNIDDRKQKELEMISKADTDGMTGVLNKAAFMRLAEKELSGGRINADSAFVILDVDDFKSVNDTYGHPAGDRVLTSVGGLLRERFGGENAVGRLGGDEFGILVRNIQNRIELDQLLSGILQDVSAVRIPELPEECRISLSIGATMCEGTKLAEIYQNADRALYESKQNGKNRFTVVGR